MPVVFLDQELISCHYEVTHLVILVVVVVGVTI